MAEFYKVLKAEPLGDAWTPNKPGAKPIQNYWCQVEGQDWAVSIGRQTDNPLRPGVHVYGNLMYAKSQKGTEYWKFKGEKVPDDVQRPTDEPGTPAQATAQAATNVSGVVPGWFITYGNMIEYIYKQMKSMDTEAEPEAEPVVETEMEVLSGEVNEKTQATLDAVFGDEDK